MILFNCLLIIAFAYAENLCDGKDEGFYAFGPCNATLLSCVEDRNEKQSAVLVCSKNYFFNAAVKSCDSPENIPECAGVDLKETNLTAYYRKKKMDQLGYSENSADINATTHDSINEKEDFPCIPVQIPANGLNDAHCLEQLQIMEERARLQLLLGQTRVRECYMTVDTKENRMTSLQSKAVNNELPTVSVVMSFRVHSSDKRFIMVSMCMDLKNGSFYCNSEIDTVDYRTHKSKVENIRITAIRKIGELPKSEDNQVSEEHRFSNLTCNNTECAGQVNDYLAKIKTLKDVAILNIRGISPVEGCFLGFITNQWKPLKYEMLVSPGESKVRFGLYSAEKGEAWHASLQFYGKEDDITCRSYQIKYSSPSELEELLKQWDSAPYKIAKAVLRGIKWSLTADYLQTFSTVFGLNVYDYLSSI